MKDRLKALRDSEGLSMKKFGDRIGVSASTIALLESGERNITERVMRDICREFNINEEWMLSGTGEMKAPETKEKKIANVVKQLYGADENSFEFQLATMLSDMSIEDMQKVKDFIKNLAQYID